MEKNIDANIALHVAKGNLGGLVRWRAVVRSVTETDRSVVQREQRLRALRAEELEASEVGEEVAVGEGFGAVVARIVRPSL